MSPHSIPHSCSQELMTAKKGLVRPPANRDDAKNEEKRKRRSCLSIQSVCNPPELRGYDSTNNDPILALRSSPCRCRGVLQCCSNVYRSRETHRHPHFHAEGLKCPKGEPEQVCIVRHVRSEVLTSHVDNGCHARMAGYGASVGRTVQYHEERDRHHDGLAKDNESGPGSDPSLARKRIGEGKVGEQQLDETTRVTETNTANLGRHLILFPFKYITVRESSHVSQSYASQNIFG